MEAERARANGWRLAVWIGLAGEAAFVAAAIPFSDFTTDGNVLWFVPLMMTAGAAFLAVAWLLRESALQLSQFWIIALALRLVAMPMAPGDDVWRLLWEGRIQADGWNPYLHAPASEELRSLRDQRWEWINHPETVAIYPPAAELVFAGLSRISPTVCFFKVIFIFADLATVALLLRLPGVTTGTAVWYAWNPAVVYAFAGGGHYDSLMLCPLVGAMLLLNGRRETGREAFSCLLLGIAIAIKVIPVFLLPAWIVAMRKRTLWVLLAVAVPAALSWWYGGPKVVFGPLLAFSDVTRSHDLIWWAVEAISGPNPFGRNWPYTAVLLAVIAGATWRFRGDWRHAALWSLGLALVLSPTLHPWYVIWILPLAIWQRAPAWVVLSISALGAFLLWESTALWTEWQANWFTRLIVIAPPLLAWRLDAGRTHRHLSPL